MTTSQHPRSTEPGPRHRNVARTTYPTGPRSRPPRRHRDGIAAWITGTAVSSQLLLDQGEVVVDEVVRHWWVYMRPALLAVVGLALLVLVPFVAIDASGVLLVASLVLFARAAWRVVRERRDRFVITNIRVFRVRGMFGSHVASMPLTRILDISLEKPALGRLLGFGHFCFESAAQDQGLREVTYVPRADARNRRILELVHEPALRTSRHE